MLNFKQKVLSKYTVVEGSDGFSKILDEANEGDGKDGGDDCDQDKES